MTDPKHVQTPEKPPRRQKLAAWAGAASWVDWALAFAVGLVGVFAGWGLSVLFTEPVLVPSPAVTVTATPAAEAVVGEAVVVRVELTNGGAKLVRVRRVDDPGQRNIFGVSELAGGLRSGDVVRIIREPVSTPSATPSGGSTP